MSAYDEETLLLEIGTVPDEMPCASVLPWPLSHGLKVNVIKYGLPSPIHAVTFDVETETVNVALENGQRGKIDDNFFEINYPELLQALSGSTLRFDEDDPRQLVWANTIMSAWGFRAAKYREPGDL